MQVENFTQDFMSWNGMANNGRGAYGIKQVDGKIAKSKVERMVRDAKEKYLNCHAIDWSQYGEPTITFFEMVTAQVAWTRNDTDQQIVLTNIYWNNNTGEILQAGSNHGDLVM